MCRSLALMPVLLAILIAGCRITVVSTPRPDAAQVAADTSAADTTAVDAAPGTRRPAPPRPTLPTTPAAAPAPALPQIVLQAPSQWAGTARDTLVVPVADPLAVRGEVHHDERVDAIRVNGQPATILGSGGGVTRFAATIEPTRAGVMEVRVEARAAAGTSVASYFLDAGQRTATARPRGTPPGPPTPPVTPPTTPPVTPPPGADTTIVEPPPPPPGPDTTAIGPPPTAADSAWGARGRWAVVIGVGDHADGSIPAREFAARDARAFRDFLRSPAAGTGGVPAARTLVLLDGEATRAGVQRAFTTFLADVRPDDVVLVFLAGTAMPDPQRPTGAYLLPHDARPDALSSTALSVQWLTEALRDVRAHQKIVFADLLQAAGEPRGRGAAATPAQNLVHRALESAGPRDRSLVVLTAVGAGNTPAQEGTQWGGGHGAFSHYLLAGLRGAADADNDGIVTLSEIVLHTRDAVRQGTGNAQIPGVSAASYDRSWPMARVIQD